MSDGQRTVDELFRKLRIAENDLKKTEAISFQPDTGDAFLVDRNESNRKRQGNKGLKRKVFNQESQDKPGKDKECWYCGKKGHFKADCRKRQSERNIPRKEDTQDMPCAYGLFSNKRTGWIGDSGAYTHMTGRKDWFTELLPIKPEVMTSATREETKVTHARTIDVEVFDGKTWQPRQLKGVRYVPDFGDANLLSTGRLASIGFEIIQRGDKIDIKWKEKTAIRGTKKGNIYEMNIRTESNTAYFTQNTESLKDIALSWHLRRSQGIITYRST